MNEQTGNGSLPRATQRGGVGHDGATAGHEGSVAFDGADDAPTPPARTPLGELERELLTRLPHRYPMLMVDRVLEFRPPNRLRALKNVTANEPYFESMPRTAMAMPCGHVVEALAQTCGLLYAAAGVRRETELLVLARVSDLRVAHAPVPGDQLWLEAELLQARSLVARFRAKARLPGGVEVASAKLAFTATG